MNRLPSAGFVLLLAVGLQGCCFRTGEVDRDPGADEAAAATPATLGIVDWGPRQTRAGTPFNLQQDGQAAIWILVDQPLDGRGTTVRFNDTLLDGDVSGTLVTAVVPAALYATAGGYRIQVVARDGDTTWSSNNVVFTVE